MNHFKAQADHIEATYLASKPEGEFDHVWMESPASEAYRQEVTALLDEISDLLENIPESDQQKIADELGELFNTQDGASIAFDDVDKWEPATLAVMSVRRMLQRSVYLSSTIKGWSRFSQATKFFLLTSTPQSVV